VLQKEILNIMNPKVSIIIATFNSDKTLRHALNSVLNLSFYEWECIVIDGQSKDNTIEIVKEYASKDARFRYISEPDKGIYDAFNKGWKLANGEWVIYLGSDDEYVESGISSLYNNSFDDSDVVYGDVILKYPSGKERIQKSKECHTLDNLTMPCCHQAMMMKRNVIRDMNGFDKTYKIIADKELVCRCYFARYRFQKIQVPVAKFYIGGISQKSYAAVFEDYKICKNYAYMINPYVFLCKSIIRRTLVLWKHKLENIFNK